MESDNYFDHRFLQTKFGALHMVSKTPDAAKTNIVLIHGLVVNSEFMLPTARYLALKHNVFIPDLIGNGKSDNPPRPLTIGDNADTIIEALQQLNVENPILVGGSYGAHIAVELANRDIAPRALVFVGPLPGQTPLQGIKGLSLDAPHEPFKLVMDVLNESFIRMGPLRVAKMLAGIGLYPFHERLENVQIPTLVIHGEHDPFYSAPFMEKIERVARTTHRVGMPKAAHGLPYSQPAVICDFINSFMDSIQTIEEESASTFEEDESLMQTQKKHADDDSIAA